MLWNLQGNKDSGIKAKQRYNVISDVIYGLHERDMFILTQEIWTQKCHKLLLNKLGVLDGNMPSYNKEAGIYYIGNRQQIQMIDVGEISLESKIKFVMKIEVWKQDDSRLLWLKTTYFWSHGMVDSMRMVERHRSQMKRN